MRQPQQANLTLDKGDLILTSPFNRGLVEGIKALPYHDRQWDNTRKVWRIKYMWGSDVATLVKHHLGQELNVPRQITFRDPGPITRMFKVEYIGSIRERDDGSQTATGFANGEWGVIFPANVLRKWFTADDAKPDEAPTLYAVLGIKRNATPDEVRKAHRLAARTWHPDVNKEPDAQEQFIRIQRAYEVLNDEQQRRKYNAALMFERDANKYAKNRKSVEHYGWQPPTRCGFVTCEGIESLGRFTVAKILAWQNITNEAGLSMVSYWPNGSDKFEMEWI
jgi:hypothetical protein